MALRRALTLLTLLTDLCLLGCAPRQTTHGVASWYGPGFAGRPTASGVPFRPAGRTAAHRSLPFGTVLEVRHEDRTVRVVVNDRGPFVAGRDLDLSKGAARRIGLIAAGVAPVSWTVVGCRSSYDGPRGCASDP